MPMELLVHSRYCDYRRGLRCTCKPRTFTDAHQAVEAHEGDAARLQVGAVVPPPSQLPPSIRAEQSQARRHTRSISD